MFASFFSGLFLFGLALGLAWPIAMRLRLDPAEKLAANAALSLLGIFLFAWAVYVFALPTAVLWVLPILGFLGLVVGRGSLPKLWLDRNVRQAFVAQAIVTAWCVGWLALTRDYSGGGWSGDWHGHWHRARFFLERGPHDILFDGFDPLTSRPPLANVIVGVFLRLTRIDFAHYQLASTLFSSLAFLPAALLARRFGGARPLAIATLFFLLNPSFIQNATFAWTKLPAAFFILLALYFFLRAHDADRPAAAGMLFSLNLAAALLAHYSAGPYAVVLAVAWFAFGRRHLGSGAWWRQTLVAAAAGVLLLATWFGWAVAIYGAKGTLLTNTSVTDNAHTVTGQLEFIVLNIRDTFIPHFLRDVDLGFIAQTSPWGWWRDWFFQLYQVNFFFTSGSVAWVVLLVLLARESRGAPRGQRAFWCWFIVAVAFLGVAVHGARDTWGLAHICLQPLVLLGLAFLAARWGSLGASWRRIVIAGAATDFLLGIALQFGTQSYALDRWFTPGRPLLETFLSYSEVARMNVRARLQVGWVFFGESFAAHALLVVLFLAALFALACFRAARSRD